MNIYEAAKYARETGKMVRCDWNGWEAFWKPGGLYWTTDKLVSFAAEFIDAVWSPILQWQDCNVYEAEQALLQGERVQATRSGRWEDIICDTGGRLVWKDSQHFSEGILHYAGRKWRILK